MNKYAAITYELVRRLLHIPAGCDDQWDGDLPCQPPYELRTNGIYARPIDLIDGLSDTEREALEPWFPPESDGDYSFPVCPLPCDLNTFIRFVDGANLWERIVEFVGVEDDGEPVFWAAIEQYLGERGLPDPKETPELEVGRKGKRNKAGSYVERDKLIHEWAKELAHNPSRASVIQQRLQRKGIDLGIRQIQRILKNATGNDI